VRESCTKPRCHRIETKANQVEMAYYELYRRSTLGMTLTDSLDEMVTNGKLTPTIAMKVLAQFDKVRSSCSDSSILVTLFAVLPLKCMNEALKNVKTKTTFKGDLYSYRFCDNVWTFVLNNVTIDSVGSGGHKESIIVKSVKIVACDGKNTFGA